MSRIQIMQGKKMVFWMDWSIKEICDIFKVIPTCASVFYLKYSMILDIAEVAPSSIFKTNDSSNIRPFPLDTNSPIKLHVSAN
jgi:hypothetical protein